MIEENLVDMALTGEEAGEQIATEPQAVDMAAEEAGPRYPWGLSITLESESMEKLGLVPDDLAVGQEIDLQAKVRVKAVSQRESEGQERRGDVELQITRMFLDAAPGFDEAWDEAVDIEPALEPMEGGLI